MRVDAKTWMAGTSAAMTMRTRRGQEPLALSVAATTCGHSVLVMLVVTVLVIGCSRSLRGAQARRFRLQIGDQVGGVELGNPQGGHVHARELGGELERGGVLPGPHPGRV